MVSQGALFWVSLLSVSGRALIDSAAAMSFAPVGLNPFGWAVMAVTWLVLVGLNVWCLARILRSRATIPLAGRSAGGASGPALQAPGDGGGFSNASPTQ